MENRVEWIDIAKGIAIIFVIIGHTYPRDSDVWNFAYSFHMPLFFILSGYTIKKIDSWKKIGLNVIKSIKRLLLPATLIESIRIILFGIGQASLYEIPVMEGIKTVSDEELLKLFYMSAASSDDGVIPGIGMLWFLVALFYGRILFEIVLLYFPIAHFLPAMIVGMIGIEIGRRQWLPQELDCVLLVVFFLSVGRLLKEAIESEKYMKHRNLIAVMLFSTWMMLLSFGLRIEIGMRSYEYGIMTIIEAICASIFIMLLSKDIWESRVCTSWIQQIGRSSLCIFCVHYVDQFLLIRNIWQSDIIAMSSIARVAVDCICGMLISIALDKVNKLLEVKRKGLSSNWVDAQL